MRRQTGEPVEGRVTAPTEDAAHKVLGDDGIVADSLEPEPDAPRDPAPTVTEPWLAHALERALDDAGFSVSFDHLTGRYQGKSASLLGQDKTRKRLLKLVDDAAADNLGDDENLLVARRHITQLLEKVLRDRRNISSERSPQTLALEAQISHITTALGRIEKAMASMSLAVRQDRRAQPRRTGPAPTARERTYEEVLLEVFHSNLELMRGLEEPASLPAAGDTNP